MSNTPKIIYTKTDEAPALATYSFLPIVESFTKPANILLETRDISLAGRILSQFPERLKEGQQVSDDLAELGELAKQPEANIIKLPNISASIPQLKTAIEELQKKGYDLPNYPDEPKTDEEKQIKERYDKVKGSAVNPVLREGNSDRRAPKAVKNYAKKHPHSMGKWSKDSKSHVATMESNDFKHNEKSVTVQDPTKVDIQLKTASGNTTTLKKDLQLQKGEIIDGTFMSKKALLQFLEEQVKDAKDKGILFSLHMKATMMKVSDPIIFGHAVKVFFKDIFEQYGKELQEAGADPNSGLGDVLSAINKLPEEKQKKINSDIEQDIQEGPDLAMVNSDKGITNLTSPVTSSLMPPCLQ